MIITRIYTGDDGQSHMEDFDLDDHANPESLQSVTSIVFRSHDPGRFSAWHCESRRNYINAVSGEGEIGLGDGTAHRIGPGPSSVPRVTVAIPLADQSPTVRA